MKVKLNSSKIDFKLEKIAGTPKEVEEAFGLDAGTLANMRSQCRGPRYRKVGRRILYKFSDIEDWLNNFIVQTKDSIDFEK